MTLTFNKHYAPIIGHTDLQKPYQNKNSSQPPFIEAHDTGHNFRVDGKKIKKNIFYIMSDKDS